MTEHLSDRHSLDVADVVSGRRVSPGVAFQRVEICVDYEVVQVGFRARARHWRQNKALVQHVRLSWTQCGFGGRRPWFLCPVEGCGKRVAKLYLGQRGYICRHCVGLKYRSQSEPAAERRISRANRIRLRLGGKPGFFRPPPARPRGMWHRTYDRCIEELRALECAIVADTARWLGIDPAALDGQGWPFMQRGSQIRHQREGVHDNVGDKPNDPVPGDPERGPGSMDPRTSS